MKDHPRARPLPAQPVAHDYTRLPDDHPDLDQVFLAVDVSTSAPPGTDAAEANWVVRYSTG